MQNSHVLEVFLPVALALVMLGLGLSLTVGDFTRAARQPKAVITALACQLVVLPLLCWALIEAVRLPDQGVSGPELAVGMILLAASPGGVTASLFSHLFRGDVALNVTLLAINSVVAVFTLPLVVNLAVARYLSDDGQQVGLQTVDTLKVFAVVLIPVAIGMLLRRRAPGLAERSDRWVRLGSVALLVFVIVVALIEERDNIGTYIATIGLLAVAFCVINLTVGYFVPRLLGIEPRQAIAISMEIGVHNETLALTVALSVLVNPTMAIPAAVYSILKFFLIPIFGFLVTRRTDRTQVATTGQPTRR